MQSIFTTETPTTQQNDGPYTLGTVFYSDVAGFVFGVRWYTPVALPSGTVIGALFQVTDNATGPLLQQATFGALVANTWNTVLFTVPQVILPNPQLYATAVLVADNYAATPLFFLGNQVTNGHLTAIQDQTAPFATIENGKFHVGGALTYPEDSFGGGCYFADTLFDTVLPGGGHAHGHHQQHRSAIPMMSLGAD